MADERTRRHIALLAARLMYDRTESEYFSAKRKAARQLGVEYRFRPKDLPSNAEIREQIRVLASFYEGDKRDDDLLRMRLAALRMMRLLEPFRPRLIGSVLTGHVRKGSDIDLHVFTDHLSAVVTVLEDERYEHAVQHKRIRKHGEERVFTHIHFADDAGHGFELTVYGTDKVNYPFKSSITGKLIERATIPELERLLRHENPSIDLGAEIASLEHDVDRFEIYRTLLAPLADVKQSPTYHPEGDALYHSLQVFELARDRAGYDEEFLLAALLHDVGKGIDPSDHVAAGVEALADLISDRTRFLIEHHMDAHAIHDGTLGHRARQRLMESPDFDDLMLLRELDVAGRRRGVVVCTLEKALDYIRGMDEDAR
jgi:hypothetical protein